MLSWLSLGEKDGESADCRVGDTDSLRSCHVVGGILCIEISVKGEVVDAAVGNSDAMTPKTGLDEASVLGDDVGTKLDTVATRVGDPTGESLGATGRFVASPELRDPIGARLDKIDNWAGITTGVSLGARFVVDVLGERLCETVDCLKTFSPSFSLGSPGDRVVEVGRCISLFDVEGAELVGWEVGWIFC